MDADGNVVVTGYSGNGTNYDYATAKYAASDGTLLWEKRYNGSANNDDYVSAVAVDGSGNVMVTGTSFNGTNDDYYTAKYAAADGALLWEKRYNGPANSHDYAKAVAVDGSGNVIVTGSSVTTNFNYDCYTAKYAAADGSLLWEKRYDGPANGDDRGTAVAVDANGNVVVTGFSGNGTNYDYATAKYAASDGTLLWEKRYNGPANRSDYASAVAVDGSGNVVVTGLSFNSSRDEPYDGDWYTAKYSAANGALLWEKRYRDGPLRGDDVEDDSPRLALGPNGIVAIAGTSRARDYVTLVYREYAGTVVAWGDNGYGQTTVPVAAQSGVTAIAAGDEHTVALKNDGSVVAWGFNGNDEGGVGGQTNVPVAAQSGVTAIAGGRLHTVALKNDGRVLAWGYNHYGQTTVPVAAQSGVTAIAAGGYNTVALKNDGSVVAWGNNSSGQTDVPVAAQSGVAAIAAGDSHTVALKNDGSVVAWGNETNVPVAAQSGVVAIAAGGLHTVALKNDGSVLAWGYNDYGQTNVPVAAQSGVIAIAAGVYHTVALKNDGSVLAWGFNDSGQTTVPVVAQSGVTAIAAGFGHTVALLHNAPPVLPVMANRTVNELTLLTVTNPATDANLLDSLSYALIDPPAGATIDAAGTITWTPTEAQGPGVFTITTQVSDNGTPPLSSTNSFQVTVGEVNTAPVLATLNNFTIYAGQTVSFTAAATDADLPANGLTYSLVTPPAGAAINPSSGLFQWQPASNFAGTTQTITVKVTDNGIPSASHSRSFDVTVNPLQINLRIVSFAGGTVRMSLQGPAGLNCTLERSEDLETWETVSQHTLSPLATPLFDTPDPNATRMFYRVTAEL